MRALSVDELLEMYGRYGQLLAEQREVQKQLARVRLAGGDAGELAVQADALSTQLQELSDSMTFDTPQIWIAYKYRAYQDEAQPIATLHDFRMHCSKPGYICTARFEFLNDALARAEQARLSNRTAYADEMELSELLSSGVLDALDETTLETWREHEYYRDEAGRVAKWGRVLKVDVVASLRRCGHGASVTQDER